MLLRPSKQVSIVPALSLGAGCIILCCAIWFFLGGNSPSFFQMLDNKVNDLMFQIRGPIETSGSVIIVDIDEESLAEVGQWPWPRDVMARLINNITSAQPKVLGTTIVFAEKDRSSPAIFLSKYHKQLLSAGFNQKSTPFSTTLFPDHDMLLGEAFAKGSVVQGYNFLFREDFLKKQDAAKPKKKIVVNMRPTPSRYAFPSNEKYQPDLFQAYRPILNIAEVSTGTSQGFLNTFPDDNGAIRRAPALLKMDGEIYPSLSLEIYRLAEKRLSTSIEIASASEPNGYNEVKAVAIGTHRFPTDQWGQLSINFYGPYNTFLYIPARQILNNEDSFLLKNAYVLLGSSVTGIGSVVATPYSPRLPKVELQATILDNLIQKKPLTTNKKREQYLTYLAIIIFGCLITFSLVYLTPFIAIFLCTASFSATLFSSYYFFVTQQQPFTFSYASCALFLLFLLVFSFTYYAEGQRRVFIRRAFSQYISPTIVQELLKNPESLNLHVDSREVTILFCDIRNFSAIAESVSPQELNRTLTAYFNLLTEIILKNMGTVDKYIGDAIMAVWGSPLHDADHAQHAVEAALQMQQALAENNPQLFGRTIKVGIGINSGMVSAGNFGSKKRFDYTVLGDNVNLAARVEKETKNYPENLLITEYTKNRLPESISCRYIDTVQVRGRLGMVRLFTIEEEI